MFLPLTPLSFKHRAVTLFSHQTAVVDGDRRLTYAEFGERSGRLACALLTRGLATADPVACMAFNSAELLEAYYGVPEAGGILLPINIRLNAGEIAYILHDAGVHRILVDAEMAPLWSAVQPLLDEQLDVMWIGGVPAGTAGVAYDELLAASPAAVPPPLEIDENGVVELFYTSGTTGRPKGVKLTHRNLALHAMSSLITLPADDSDVMLHTIPLFHVNGWGTPQTITAVGGRHVMVRRFDPETVLRLIEAEGVSRFYAVPTMLTLLLEHPDIGRRDLSSLRLINTGGAPTPPDMIRRAEAAFGCRVFGGYGLSETSPVIALATSKAHLRQEPDSERYRRQAMTGLPVIGAEMTIVDPDGRSLPWDGETAGELVVRSNVVMDGYWNDSEASTRALRDGWFHTGDIATIDPEGYILIVDRMKDIIISGGENISSVEIEKTLYEHPAVLESAVIAVPDERWGEVPLALVVLRPDATTGEEEILAFCRERLARFKVPREVEFLPALPKGGTGKVLKAQLREPYWAGAEKRVH